MEENYLSLDDIKEAYEAVGIQIVQIMDEALRSDANQWSTHLWLVECYNYIEVNFAADVNHATNPPDVVLEMVTVCAKHPKGVAGRGHFTIKGALNWLAENKIQKVWLKGHPDGSIRVMIKAPEIYERLSNRS